MSRSRGEVRRNIMDVILLITLIVAVSGILVRYYKMQGERSEQSQVLICLEVENISMSEVRAFGEAREVHIKEGAQVIGIQSGEAEWQEFRERRISDSGDVEWVTYPERFTLRIYVIGSGSIGDEGFFLDGKTHLAPNQKINISTLKAEHSATVISVKRV